MPLANWLRTLKTRIDHQQPRRTAHRPAARHRAKANLRLSGSKTALPSPGSVPRTAHSLWSRGPEAITTWRLNRAARRSWRRES